MTTEVIIEYSAEPKPWENKKTGSIVMDRGTAFMITSRGQEISLLNLHTGHCLERYVEVDNPHNITQKEWSYLTLNNGYSYKPLEGVVTIVSES